MPFLPTDRWPQRWKAPLAAVAVALCSSAPLRAQSLGALPSSLQTADGAAQISAGFGSVVLTGTVPTTNGKGGYPAVLAAPLVITLQPSLLWSVSVPGANLEIVPPSVATATRRPIDDTEASFGWQPAYKTQTGSTESTWQAGVTSFRRARGTGFGEESAAFTTENGVDSLAASSGGTPAGAIAGGDTEGLSIDTAQMAPAQAALATSCLDSAAGCSGLTLPPIFLPPAPTSSKRLAAAPAPRIGAHTGVLREPTRTPSTGTKPSAAKTPRQGLRSGRSSIMDETTRERLRPQR